MFIHPAPDRSRVKRNRKESAEEESMVKNMFLAGIAALMMFAAQAWAADTTPKSVIHVITIQWKSDATPDKIDKAIKGAEALPGQYSGIPHVWTKPIKK